MPGTDLYSTQDNVLPTNKIMELGSPKASGPINLFVDSGDRRPDYLPPLPEQIAPTVTTKELYDNRKFGLYNPNKTEEDYAYGQSALDKAGNGLAKLAGTTASTIVNNSVGLLYGATSALVNQKFSSLYDNEFFKRMDTVSQEMENRFPHYYTEAERKDPLALKSIFTGNFFWDKIVKNLGYSAGAAVTAYGATAALEALQLSKGLVAAGRGLQALEATEAGLAEGRGMAGIIQALKNPRSVASKLGQGLESLGTIEAGAQASTATRLLSSYLGVSGEAGMESYHNAKSLRENLIDVFRKEHGGQDPTGQDLQDIQDAAENVGNWSFGLNVALLTGTEYVQLPKIFGSTYSGEKKILNNIMFKDNLWKSALPEKGFGKFLYKAGNVGSLFFNTAEAFEEGAQFAIQEGTQNFFNKKYRNGEQTSFWNSLGGLLAPGGQGVLGYGAGQAVTSEEGLENILLGGLSGALMTSGVVGTRRTEDGTTVPTMFQTGKIGERGFTGYGGEKGRFTEEATKALNSAKFTDLVDSVNRGMSINEDREKTLRQGDILQSKDLETDYMLNYLLPRIKYGGETIFNTEVEAIAQKAATEAGFMELKDSGIANENDTQQSFVARLNNIQNMSKKVTENYDKFRTKYTGLAKTKEDGTPELDADGNLQRKYDDSTVDKMVYTASKIFDYNNRIPGLSSKLSTSNVDVTTILAEINFTGKPAVESVKEALQTINDLNEIDATKTDLKTSLQDVIELALRRNKFIDEFNNIEKNPDNYKEGVDETITSGDTVKIKQFDTGDKGKLVNKRIEVGKEYSLANPLANVGGKLQFAPKLTVLSKTLRGEFEVRLPNGERAFLTPSDFKDYQLFGGSEDVSTLQDILDKAIDKMLSKDKYNDVTKPTENKLEYVNSLNNIELVDEIEKEFQAQAEEYLKESIKEQKAIESANLGKELAETQDIDSLPTADFDSGSFEPSPKKTDQQVVDSTTAPVEGFSQDELAPHHVRANKFGANFYDLPGKDNFRGVIVTSANEAKVGLPGLTNWLKTQGTNDPSIKPEETIALVVMGTDPITNERFFVGVNGERLENPTLENTIYQVFPKTLTQSNGDSMFRETTDDDTREQYTKEYKAWRESTLKNPSIDLYKIGASFGVPDRIPSASISVVSSGLVSADDLNTRRVIGIPTTDGAVVYGSSTFEGVKGVPLLYTANGLVRLSNRKNTKKEAELIFDVIERLASNLIKDKNLKSGESQALYNWLKSVVYWGTPQDVNGNRKPAAYSSIFFENMQLLIGKEETKFSIKPSDLKQNRDAIVGKLQEMYNNVNSTLVTGGQTKQWNKPYTEITGIEGDNILTRDWKNYQTYLLSSESLPLSTSVRPLNNEEDVNRKGIYFTVYDKKGNTSNEVPAAKPVKKEPTPAAPTATAEVNPLFNLEKGAENTISIPKLGDVSFIVDRKAFEESNGTKGVALSVPETTLEITIGKLLSVPNSGITEETPDDEATKIAENVLRNIVIKEVKAQLAPAAAPVVEQVPAEDATVATNALDDLKQLNANLQTGDEKTAEEKLAGIEIQPDQPTPVKEKPLEFGEVFVTGTRLGQGDVYGNVPKYYPDRRGDNEYNAGTKKYFKEEVIQDKKIFTLVDTSIVDTANRKGFVSTSISVDKNSPTTLADVKTDLEAIHARTMFGVDNSGKIDKGKVTQALTGVRWTSRKTEEPTPTPNVSANLQARINARKKAGPTKRGSEYRLKVEDQLKKFQSEDWNKVEKFIAKVLPNVPVYRVKNIIQATNGKQAWGMLKDGAIYLYENAEVGTVYHEVFEAVWKMFTTAEERTSIINEFKGRKGIYTDSFTGRDVKYSDATDQEIKEQLAEEFRDQMLSKEAKKDKSLISRIFSQIIDFIKTFFVGDKAQENTDKLFENIGSGYYAQYSPFHGALSYAKEGIIDIEDAVGSDDAEYRITGFTGTQLHDVIQHMTYTIVKDLFETNEGLTNLAEKTKQQIYSGLQDEMGDLIADNVYQLEQMTDVADEDRNSKIEEQNTLYSNILNNWEAIVDKHEEYLKSYSIEFDENDELSVGDERSKDDAYGDASKIDHMKKANSAIKLLLASLPAVYNDGSERLSSIGGYTLVPMSEAYIGVMNNVSSSKSIDDMLGRLKEMSTNDPKYTKLYNRLTKLKEISQLNNQNDIQLLSAFWRTFKKQSPTVKNVYVLENGDVQVGDSNFTAAARQVEEGFVNNIINAVNNGNKYITYSATSNSYIGNEDSIKDEKLNSLLAQVNFLKEFGIEFDYDRLVKMREKTTFSEAVNGIRTSIAGGKRLITVSGRTLEINKRLYQISEIKAIMDNPEFSSTFYNVNGELTQTFIGTNAASDLFDVLSQIKNINELQGTQYEYLLTDAFAKNSNMLYRMFDRTTGKRIEGSEDLMQTAYADGTVDEDSGKQKQSSKLNYKERLLQELNLNLDGYYLNLIPGDATLEWMMNMGNPIIKDDILLNLNRVFDIFKGYFIDEMNLAREDRNVAKGRDALELRFFKSILGEKLHNDIMAEEGEVFTAEEIYDNNKQAIDDAVAKYITLQKDRLSTSLEEYGIMSEVGNGYMVEGLSFAKEDVVPFDEMDRQLKVLSINYMINNIELHKLLYSDPYQYSDELKRIKSFNSPRQAIVGASDAFNSAANNIWNKGIAEGTIGYTDFNKDFFRSVTLGDVIATSDLPDYGSFEETDGGGMITLKGLRNFKIRAGEWDGAQERQYKYDIAYEKKVKGIKLSSVDRNALKKGNPKVKRTYTPIKPIVSGNKANGRNFNDIVLDKFALYPLSFRVLHEMNPESNAVKLYNKMQAENVDYAVYNTGRKVGAEAVHELYKDGQFNDAPFQTEKQTENKDLKQGVINIPFSIMSIQSEVPSKDDGIVTRGSQMTKLVTLDFMDAGVPIDYNPTGTFTERYMEWFGLSESEKENKSPLYKEIKNNQQILEDMMEVGINSLLNTFGITKVDGGYKIENDDFEKVVETLRKEFTKREISDNLSAALRGYSNGTVVAEATPAYKQIRNILYSIADREVISPKVSGGMKVQIPSTLLESNRVKADKGGYTSDVLNFYVDKDGQRVCEIMVGRWFESDLSDEDLLKKLNSTSEGQRILEGVAFRIPTQKQNSIDVFRVAKFLPKEFGDSVVVPSALVKKVGSDFDIDKLSIYLKNVDDKSKGLPKLISVNGKGKSNLENAYIESLERLISHPLNFKNLVKPNSAEQLKDLSKDITTKLGFGTFDYKDPGNMLDRSFMSRLRHAFVSGKYAIGIAAVNQTNNSLNQRQPIYIDFAGRKDLLEPGDLKWLGDGKINFPEYNTIEIPGKGVLPTLSLSKNAEGQYISDILGQMIDGYVDISKGPWIMELGATPNVASTWMFLVKVGVPIDTVAYFMNQPIIRDYLRTLEKNGQSWLFNDKTNNAIKRKYKNNKLTVKEMPSLEKLQNTVGKKELTQVEKAEQTFILKEFLKYAKMAEQSFNVTQGTNFDTASFNDPFLVFKKLKQLDKARNTIFTSVDDMLDNAFIGKLKDSIVELRDALATILKADQGNVREVIQKVLTPYVGMNDRDFVKTSQRAVATLFDWAVQTQNGLNAQITDILLNKDTNVAKEISEFVKPILDPLNEGHPLHNNQVVKILQPLFGKPGEVNNVKIKNKTNKVYDQNQITYAFVELKEYLKSEGKIDLYDRLVTLSILQSGLNESNISFTSQLPYEDIVKQYNEVLADLPANANLDTFADLNVFERTFWNFDDVVPHHKATYRFDFYTQQTYYNEEMKFGSGIYDAMRKGDLPLLLKVKPGSREANYDVVVHTWEKEISSSEKRKMRKDGDYSYKKKGLFKKIGIIPSADGLSETYLYKLINAWGDGTKANEFYTEARKSVIDNKFEQADESIPDDIILQYFGVTKEEMISPLPEEVAVSPEIQTSEKVINAVPKENEIIGNIAMQSDNVIRIKAGTKTITNRNENYRDGVYALPDGSRVELTNLGQFQVVGDRVVGDEASYSVDEFAAKEGFKDWNDFKMNNKYSTNFINGRQARFVYAVKPVSDQPIENQEEAEPGEKKATELPSGELVFEDKSTTFVTLRDGKNYDITEINGDMLKNMGYSPIEIGKVLKEIC